MFEPIFVWEMAPARRAGLWKLRRAFVLLLLVEMFLCLFGAFREQTATLTRFEWQERHGVVWRYYQLFCEQHVVALLFITPLLAAGALTREKSQGTFELLLTTELESSDIVFGKLAAQVLQATLWTAPTWPVVALLHGLLGLPGWSLAVWLAGMVAFTAALAAVSLFCSGVMRTSPGAMIASYGVIGLLLAALASSADLGELMPWNADGMRHCWRSPSVLILLATTLVLLTILSGGLRWLYRWSLDREHRRGSIERSREHPALEEEPLYWKQCWLGTTSRLPLLRRMPRGTTMVLGMLLAGGVPFLLDPTFGWCVTHAFAMVFGFAFVAAVRGSATISGEREAQTWDCLLRTPLASFEIVTQNFQGIRDRLHVVWIVYGVVVLVWCLRTILLHEDFRSVMSALAMVVAWLLSVSAIRAGAATGIHSSAKSPTIWQSLIPALFAAIGQLLHVALLSLVFAAVLVAGTMMFGFFLGLLLFLGLLIGFTVMAHRTLIRYSESDLNMATRILKEMEHRLHVPDWVRAEASTYNKPQAASARNEAG